MQTKTPSKGYSKSPWTAVKSEDRAFDTILEAQGKEVCQLHNGYLNFDSDHINKNAVLIAAAPELLEVLTELYESNQTMTFIPLYLQKKMKTIIDKATNI